MSRENLHAIRDRQLRDYALFLEAEGPGFKAFRLGPASGSRMGAVSLIFTEAPLAKRIIITGDLCPSHNGIIGDAGYGIGWFGSKKSGDYLCEKFLRRVFVPERAFDALLDHALDIFQPDGTIDEDAQDRFTLLDHALADAEDDPRGEDAPTRSSEAFYEMWCEAFGDGPEDLGWDYPPSEAALLCAIQRKFVELWTVLEQKDPT